MDEKHLENEKKYRDKTNMYEKNIENLKCLLLFGAPGPPPGGGSTTKKNEIESK